MVNSTTRRRELGVGSLRDLHFKKRWQSAAA